MILAVSMHLPYPSLPKTLVPKAKSGGFGKADPELLVAVIPGLMLSSYILKGWMNDWFT